MSLEWGIIGLFCVTIFLAMSLGQWCHNRSLENDMKQNRENLQQFAKWMTDKEVT